MTPVFVPPNPHLFPTLSPHFEAAGHTTTNDINRASIVFLDMHTRVSPYDEKDLNYLLNGDLQIVSWEEFDKGGLSTLDWPHPLTGQQKKIFDHIERHKIKSVHFCRLLNKKNKYPFNVFPYEKSIQYQEPMVSKDELFNRQYDVVFIANTAPQRELLKKELERDGRFRCNIILGDEKIPFQDWVNKHKEGRFFVKWSAGGYGCEKAQCLFSVAAMIKEDNDQLLLHDWSHLNNCIKLSSIPTSNQLNTLYDVVSNKDKLYELYTSNYRFMKSFYTSEYIALDILEKIKSHL
jgi:hypothetical protein